MIRNRPYNDLNRDRQRSSFMMTKNFLSMLVGLPRIPERPRDFVRFALAFLRVTVLQHSVESPAKRQVSNPWERPLERIKNRKRGRV